MSDTKFRIIFFFVYTALIVGVTWYTSYTFYNTNNSEKTKIESSIKKIDSLKTIRNQKLDSIKTESNLSVKKSSNLIKKIKHEKIIIPDTTYDYMCKYMQNYRPE